MNEVDEHISSLNNSIWLIRNKSKIALISTLFLFIIVNLKDSSIYDNLFLELILCTSLFIFCNVYFYYLDEFPDAIKISSKNIVLIYRIYNVHERKIIIEWDKINKVEYHSTNKVKNDEYSLLLKYSNQEARIVTLTNKIGLLIDTIKTVDGLPNKD